MNTLRKSLKVLGLFVAVGLVQACTDLDEKVYDKIPADQFGTNQEQLDALIGPLYGKLGDWYGVNADLNATTDEMVVPTRGGDWKDGDKWKRFEEHTWDVTLDDGSFNGLWTWAFGEIAKINQQLKNPAITAEQTLAELKTLRAFYYFVLLDGFGRVPIVTGETASGGDGGSESAQKSRVEVYNFVVSELTAALPKLSANVGGTNYGRMNKWVARTILAKTYLNAEVYTGTPQWAKAFEQCDSIIKSGKFQLAADFFSNFTAQNQGSPEIILATPMDKTKRTGFNFMYATLHYTHQLTYDLGGSPWNGYSAATEFYNSFDDADVRKKMWLVGQQYDIGGKPLKDDVLPMVLDPDIPSFVMPAGPEGRLKGARFAKYEIQLHNKTSGNSQDNDVIIFRLADVMMMRGEANFRLGAKQAAADDFNAIRNLRGVPAFNSSLTEADMLAERGREMAFEFWRRNDQIRFGTWTGTWRFKPVSPASRALWPIPQSQINLNPALTQNPGY